MCIKLSLCLRVLAVAASLTGVAIVASSLTNVQKNESGEKGCYFHHPHPAVCIYTDAVAGITVLSALFFIVCDCAFSLRPKRGKRLKQADVVFSVVMCLLWVSCGGTMAAYEADLKTSVRDMFSKNVQNLSKGVIVISWIGAVTWALVTVTVCCSKREPQTAQGLMADATEDDDILTKSEENRPLLAKT